MNLIPAHLKKRKNSESTVASLGTGSNTDVSTNSSNGPKQTVPLKPIIKTHTPQLNQVQPQQVTVIPQQQQRQQPQQQQPPQHITQPQPLTFGKLQLKGNLDNALKLERKTTTATVLLSNPTTKQESVDEQIPGPSTPGAKETSNEDEPSLREVSARLSIANELRYVEETVKGYKNHQFAHYRPFREHRDQVSSAVMDALIDAFPWPPKCNCFFSGGYYKLTPAETAQDEKISGENGIDFPPNYLKVEGIDSLVTEPELAAMFPRSEKIYIRKGNARGDGDIVRLRFTKITNPGGSALIKFSSRAEADNSFSISHLRKLGPGRLDWLFEDEIRIENVPESEIAMLKKTFPHAKSIVVNKGKNQAIATFRSLAEARKVDKDNLKTFMNLGERVLGCTLPEDAYLTQIPWDVKNPDVLDALPEALAIYWLLTPEGRVALIKFKDALTREQSFIKSRFKKMTAFHWVWTPDEAHSWEPKKPVPECSILVSDLDNYIAEDDIRNVFPTSVSVNVKRGSDREIMALVMFHSVSAADAAYQSTSLVKLGKRNVDWLFSDELKVFNYTSNFGEQPFRDEFTTVQLVKLRKHREQAVGVFQSADEVKNALKTTKLIHLGGARICWKNPHETYILHVPATIQDSRFKKLFPHAKKIKKLQALDGSQIIVVAHNNVSDQKKAYHQSTLGKSQADPQMLTWKN